MRYFNETITDSRPFNHCRGLLFLFQHKKPAMHSYIKRNSMISCGEELLAKPAIKSKEAFMQNHNIVIMGISGAFVMALIIGIFLSYFILRSAQNKSTIEILCFSILFVISGFGLVFLNLPAF